MSEHSLRALLPGYGLRRDAPLRLLHRSENDTWLAGDGDHAIILRHHRLGYHARAEIASELDWLAALQGARDLRCPRPLADRNGRMIHLAVDRFVTALAVIAGREPRVEDDLFPWFEALGRATARLHRHARGWRRPRSFIRKRWDTATLLGPRAHWGDWRRAPGLQDEDCALLELLSHDLAARLAAYGSGADRFGLIHADLRLANLLSDPAGLWVIDFDDCGFGWWMYDFAAAVSFMETDPRLPELAACWAVGYARVAGDLSSADRAMLPVLVMVRRLQLTAWMASRSDSDTARTVGAEAYAAGTVELAERFLMDGPDRFWGP